MLKMFRDYVYHLAAHPETFLCKFFGLYTVYIEKDGSTKTVVVMNNVFGEATVEIQEKYDLKGSSRNRIVSPERIKEGEAGKDLNFKRQLHLGKRRTAFMKQLAMDAWFLERLNVMDYSFLLGVLRVCEIKACQ